MTLIKFGTPSNISSKRVKLQTSNLAYWCMWTSPKWTNKISDKGRGLGHDGVFFVYNSCGGDYISVLSRDRFDSLQTTTTNHLFLPTFYRPLLHNVHELHLFLVNFLHMSELNKEIILTHRLFGDVFIND